MLAMPSQEMRYEPFSFQLFELRARFVANMCFLLDLLLLHAETRV